MRKVILLFTLGILTLFGLVGCSDQDKTETTLSEPASNEPTSIVQTFIQAVNNYEYTTTYNLFTVEYQEQYSMISDFINNIKLHNKIDAEKVKAKPDVLKTTSNKADIWYRYADNEYVFYELIKENNQWKINNIKLWSTAKNGDPKDVNLK